MKTIKTVGVVGAGTMGAALAQKFAQEGFNVILADRAMNFVEKGINNIKSVLTEGVERKVFTADQVNSFLSSLKGTDKLEDLKVCDLVVEAIFENFEAKKELFTTLSSILRDDCILATNTSSYSVTELSAFVKLPSRFVGLHFFYHAAKNRLVEIIPGANTSEETIELTKRFAVLAGKDAISCRDANGFVVNRFFVPWLNESVRLLAEGVASIEKIDEVCMKVFGIGMGPFALMNATGVPVAYHAEKTLEVFGKLYLVADALKVQAESGKIWPIGAMENLPVHEAAEKQIRDRMLGVIFFVASQLLDEKVCTATDIDRGAKIGLRWRKGPVELMKEIGEAEVKRVISDLIKIYDMKMPVSIGADFWKTESVKVTVKNDVAVIQMDQPESMNALNEQSMSQLEACFTKADEDANVKTIYIIGSGKAFVAGADIKFFVKNIKKGKLDDIQTFTAYGQKVFDKIDNSKKKVVAILNGLALGGGLELAFCADVILALPKAQLAFPETGIGIYPGLGGTQRSVRKIGKGLGKYLIHTGKMLSSKEAAEIGIVDKIISTDEMFALLSGETKLPEIKKSPLNAHWQGISDFFEKNSLQDFLSRNYSNHSISKEDAEKLLKTMSFKAPIAIRIADKLIDEALGCSSELTHLKEIFSTSDALLGLTSIGKRVEYSGK